MAIYEPFDMQASLLPLSDTLHLAYHILYFKKVYFLVMHYRYYG